MFKLPWNLTDLAAVRKNGFKVFSCFHCGGGSTMGYKLAGYDVLGGVEIDPQMMSVYRANHNPKHSYLMGVQDFHKIPSAELPRELFDLDILDGSPPCSSFSTAGAREKKWGVKAKFREGQAEQVLDDLFFHFIEIARKLQPKIVVAENVKGLVIGKAKGYVKQIRDAFNLAGYDCQLFILNAAFMGVPQRRERTFFIARRKSLGLGEIKLAFNSALIPFSKIKESGIPSDITPRMLELWRKRRSSDRNFGDITDRELKKRTGFTCGLQRDEEACFTITASDQNILYSEPRHYTVREVALAQTFPDDYNFLKLDPKYICGMSVPPIMMAQVARQIDYQLLSKLKKGAVS